jgi:hypothetical protein
VTTTLWIICVWVVSAIAFISFERLMAKSGGNGVWDPKEPSKSLVEYCLLLLFSPLIMPCVLGYWSWVGWRKLIGKPIWLDHDILERLVKRRQKYDEEIKDETISDWPARTLWNQPEDMICDITKKCVTLESNGVSQPIIWQKLEAFRAKFGTGEAPSSPTLFEYVKYRLEIEAPRYLTFGEELLQQQIKDSIAHARHNLDKPKDEVGYPPARLRGQKLFQNEIEKLGVRKVGDLSRPSRYDRQISHLKFRMLDGDEIWTYGTGATNGVTLVRNARSVDYVVTTWMSR